jgi:hypothetical protein
MRMKMDEEPVQVEDRHLMHVNEVDNEGGGEERSSRGHRLLVQIN